MTGQSCTVAQVEGGECVRHDHQRMPRMVADRAVTTPWRSDRRPVDVERMKAARRELGLSKRALANLLGVHHGVYWNWESGRHWPAEDMLPRIEHVLGVDITCAAEVLGPIDSTSAGTEAEARETAR
ncbi:MAG: helix-turn-helix transcriptional regulator [Polyangiaceae bacterium]